MQGINLPWPLNYQIGLYKVKYFKNRNKNTQLGFSVEWKRPYLAKITNIENLKQGKRLYKILEIKPRKVKKAPVKYC